MFWYICVCIYIYYASFKLFFLIYISFFSTSHSSYFLFGHSSYFLFVFYFLILCKALILLHVFFDQVYDSYFSFLRVWYGISLWLSICILRVLIGNKYSSMNINYREIFLTKINSKIEEPKLVDYVTSTLNK